jgi:hypothetical protein
MTVPGPLYSRRYQSWFGHDSCFLLARQHRVADLYLPIPFDVAFWIKHVLTETISAVQS